MRYIPLLLLLGCKTTNCPVQKPCPICSNYTLDYSDVEIEDCERRLTKCADAKSYFEAQSKDCVETLLREKKRKLK